MKDIADQLEAIGRSVTGPPATDPASNLDGLTYAVTLERTYDADIDDVWEAVTDPARLARWFLPVSGDLRLGGSFQLEGNAGGEILECERPSRLRVTFGGPESILELSLAEVSDGRTALVLKHSVPAAMAGSGAGALYVGPGWDPAVVALDEYLHGVEINDPMAAARTIEAQELCRGSIERWERVVAASGTATGDQIADGVAMARAQFTPDLS